jgi:hypothetical protein
MLICPACQHPNSESSVYCEQCGGMLDALQKTPRIDLERFMNQPGWGNARLAEAQVIVLRALGTDAEFSLHLEPDAPLTLGRSDDPVLNEAFVNLAECGRSARGVSRKHIRLSIQDQLLRIEDLESTNGSFVNGKRLAPFQPALLRDGDEIRLGQLRLHVLFVSQP